MEQVEKEFNVSAANVTVSLPTTTPACRSFAAICAVAGALPLVLLTTPSYGQAGQGTGVTSPVPANEQENPEQINSETVSCKDLKARLQTTGALPIISGQRGWGDTYYGPRVPQCQFWQMPVFSYVKTTDGLCGVGYICVEKLSRD